MITKFTDADPNGIASDYTITIQWGDGTASVLHALNGQGGFVVTTYHTYVSPGTYLVTALATDAGGATATRSVSLTTR